MSDLTFIRMEMRDVQAETNLEKKVEMLTEIVAKILGELEKRDRETRSAMRGLRSDFP